jgi:LmbE family N-acetylglucosaminyl deacetylase
MDFRDGFFPEQGDQIKVWFEALKDRVNPDVILAHRQDDAHQDHRQDGRLVWNTFRDNNPLRLSTRAPIVRAFNRNLTVWSQNARPVKEATIVLMFPLSSRS